MEDRDVADVETKETWEGLHITCTPEQAVWLYMALSDARSAVQKREHPYNGNATTYDQLLDSADQWKFYDDLAVRAIRYAEDNPESKAGMRFPDGRRWRSL